MLFGVELSAIEMNRASPAYTLNPPRRMYPARVMPQARARATERLVGEVREAMTGAPILAALPSIYELMRPVVTRIRPFVSTPASIALPHSLSSVLWRPTSSAMSRTRSGVHNADACTPRVMG